MTSDNVAALLEELVEIGREHNQLLGELLARQDGPARQEACQSTEVASKSAYIPRDKHDASEVDQDLLARETNSGEREAEAFLPTSPAPSGWLRVSVRYPDHSLLDARIAAGCLCGGKIVERISRDKVPFLTCENVSKPCGCRHRPSVNRDRCNFLLTLPPRKI